jgi:hypothetical protein
LLKYYGGGTKRAAYGVVRWVASNIGMFILQKVWRIYNYCPGRTLSFYHLCRKYRALLDASGSATEDEDRNQFEMQAEQYYGDNLYIVKRMDTAFKALHADLGQVQKVLAHFVQDESVVNKSILQA